MCMCIWVCTRERERERERHTQRDTQRENVCVHLVGTLADEEAVPVSGKVKNEDASAAASIFPDSPCETLAPYNQFTYFWAW